MKKLILLPMILLVLSIPIVYAQSDFFSGILDFIKRIFGGVQPEVLTPSPECPGPTCYTVTQYSAPCQSGNPLKLVFPYSYTCANTYNSRTVSLCRVTFYYSIGSPAGTTTLSPGQTLQQQTVLNNPTGSCPAMFRIHVDLSTYIPNGGHWINTPLECQNWGCSDSAKTCVQSPSACLSTTTTTIVPTTTTTQSQKTWGWWTDWDSDYQYSCIYGTSDKTQWDSSKNLLYQQCGQPINKANANLFYTSLDGCKFAICSQEPTPCKKQLESCGLFGGTCCSQYQCISGVCRVPESTTTTTLPGQTTTTTQPTNYDCVASGTKYTYNGMEGNALCEVLREGVIACSVCQGSEWQHENYYNARPNSGKCDGNVYSSLAEAKEKCFYSVEDSGGKQGDSCNLLNPCSYGLKCHEGQCIFNEDAKEGGVCQSDGDCLEDHQCVRGICRSGSADARCYSDEDCIEGFTCKGIVSKTCQEQNLSDKIIDELGWPLIIIGIFMLFILLVVFLK